MREPANKLKGPPAQPAALYYSVYFLVGGAVLYVSAFTRLSQQVFFTGAGQYFPFLVV
jgi:hypothetical protein